MSVVGATWVGRKDAVVEIRLSRERYAEAIASGLWHNPGGITLLHEQRPPTPT